MREFRVGIGLCKPFLFLFQLRFQLCIDATRREREMERLRAMFTIDWLTRGRTVSPQILFGLV